MHANVRIAFQGSRSVLKTTRLERMHSRICVHNYKILYVRPWRFFGAVCCCPKYPLVQQSKI
jgi:hypothetical protein